MLKHKLGMVAGLACLGLVTVYVTGESTTTRKAEVLEQSEMMRAKVVCSQDILGGLVSNNFEMVSRGAEELNQICYSSEWTPSEDQVYKHHRTELHRLSQKLLRTAETRNLEGAAFTYMHTLNVCISCHQYCRDVLKIAEEIEPGQGVVPIPTHELDAGRLIDGPVIR